MIAIAILEIWHTPIFSQLVRFDFPWPKREHRLLTEALSQTLREVPTPSWLLDISAFGTSEQFTQALVLKFLHIIG